MRALVWLFTVILLALPSAAQDRKEVDLAQRVGRVDGRLTVALSTGLDAAGLALFAVSGTQKAVAFGLGPVPAALRRRARYRRSIRRPCSPRSVQDRASFRSHFSSG